MINNYFYNLPKDLQETIYHINTKNSKNILNKQLHSLYSSIKYINRAINDVESELYIFTRKILFKIQFFLHPSIFTISLHSLFSLNSF